MRKLLIFMLSCVIFTHVSAQEHLSFKGIPIDGPIKIFVEKLKAQGFEVAFLSETNAVAAGKFGGEDCEIAIYATKTSNTVCHVIVILGESNNWSTLKSTYNEYKSLLASKYGMGRSIEYFNSPFKEGDNCEIFALKSDKCHYTTYFTVPNGEIGVSLGSLRDNGVVFISYLDQINNILADKEITDSRMNDL